MGPSSNNHRRPSSQSREGLVAAARESSENLPQRSTSQHPNPSNTSNTSASASSAGKGQQQRPRPRTRLSEGVPALQFANTTRSGNSHNPAAAGAAGPASSRIGAPPLHPVSMRQQPVPVSNVGRKKSLSRRERDRTLNRGQSLRRGSTHSALGKSDTLRRRAHAAGTPQTLTCWRASVNTLTFYLPATLLAFSGMKDAGLQAAFKEKIALCILILLCMIIVGFVTFFMQELLCATTGTGPLHLSKLGTSQFFAVRGRLYDTAQSLKALQAVHPQLPGVMIDYPQMVGRDLSPLFGVVSSSCVAKQYSLPCTVPGVWPPNSTRQYDANNACHNTYAGKPKNILATLTSVNNIYLDFDDVKGSQNLLAYNGHVWDVSRLSEVPGLTNTDKKTAALKTLILQNRGRDATKALSHAFPDDAVCLDQVFRVAQLDATTVGCAVANVLVYLSLAVIVGTVGARFFLAVLFQWTIGWRLGATDKGSRVATDLKRRRREPSVYGDLSALAPPPPHAQPKPTSHDHIELNEVKGEQRANGLVVRNPEPADAQAQSHHRSKSGRSTKSAASAPTLVRGPGGAMMRPTLPSVDLPDMDIPASANTYRDLEQSAPYARADPALNDPTLMHTLIMVPCYSEGFASLRATLDSLARAYYPSTHKTIFAIADGIVQGSGNDKTTPDYLIDMMEIDERFKEDDPALGGQAKAYSYVAIADGSRRKNYARVYAGWYRYAITDDRAKKDTGSGKDKLSPGMFRTLTKRKSGKVPMILVVKCGNEEERRPEGGAAKPGNRGKRDSQVLLMNFLSKVIMDDRMNELEFEMFHKLWSITGLHPEMYETCFMVDADTRIYPDSMTHLVACLKRDPKIMGVCGETKVYNKWDSWVTMIQVYEYYISHHLGKAFESVFGGVTCLPGCFSAYRIKAPKNGLWIPILANPDIISEYEENVVDTLHTKNLLLLGEDRFLTTLMLKAFPKRRNIFVPQAICKTVVPDTFSMLLSQRRRWINSTIHNLLELVLVRDLCGTFCFSMQFVIFLEIIGSVVLPAATIFMVYLIVQAAVGHPQLLPLIMLAAILALPALLILLTVRQPVYLMWFLVYLIALPIWQFILPLYAFWHFDDFTWGETRVVSGEEGKKAEDHSKREGEFDYHGINMHTWQEWIRERAAISEVGRRNAMATTAAQQPPRGSYYPGVPPPVLYGSSGPGFRPAHASFLPPASGPMGVSQPGAFPSPPRGMAPAAGMMFRPPPGAVISPGDPRYSSMPAWAGNAAGPYAHPGGGPMQRQMSSPGSRGSNSPGHHSPVPRGSPYGGPPSAGPQGGYFPPYATRPPASQSTASLPNTSAGPPAHTTAGAAPVSAPISPAPASAPVTREP
ncbi:Chitin synthase, class 3 [Geranomyces variabilis]|nr:Chitin synthase, class 3 [Geranomyces variabilis]